MISKRRQIERQTLFDKNLKVCSNTKCANNNPQPHTNFSKCTNSWDGFQTRCKTCKQQKSPKTIRREKLYEQGFKICANPKCVHSEEPQSFSHFHRSSTLKNSYSGRCKTCINTSLKDFRNTPEGISTTERYKKSGKRKRDLAKYHQSDKYKQVKKKYYSSEKGRRQYRKCTVTRRTRITQAGGSYTTAEWYALCEFYEFRCLMCNQEFPFDQLTVDHIKPVSKEGTSFIWNLQPLCGTCNKRKGDRTLDLRQTLPDWIKREREIYHQLSLL